VLDDLDREAGALATAPFSIGHIAIGCALSYLDFRFAELDWRRQRPLLANWRVAFAERPSAQANLPVDDS